MLALEPVHDLLWLKELLKAALLVAGEHVAAFVAHVKVALDHQKLEFEISFINPNSPYSPCQDSFGGVKGYFYVSNY